MYQAKLEAILGITIPSNKVSVIPNAVHSYWLENTPTYNVEPDDTIRILSVGKVDRNKNHRALIDAVVKLNKDSSTTQYELTIIGDYNSSYGRSLNRLQVRPNNLSR